MWCRHEWVALLPALALHDVVAVPLLADPRVGAGAAVELAGVGQQWVQLTVAEPSTKHCLNMVEAGASLLSFLLCNKYR